MEPSISIIIPVRNKAATIGQVLRALLCQDVLRHQYEVIVVDDGSTDESLSVVRNATIDPCIRAVETGSEAFPHCQECFTSERGIQSSGSVFSASNLRDVPEIQPAGAS